jgi:putative ABC transport system substrate-binding protein
MRRREFLSALGGVATIWPYAALAQNHERMRRIGILIGFPENDPQTKSRLAAFRQELERLGWVTGRNVRYDYRFSPAISSDQAAGHAKELIAMQPDAVLALAPPFVAAMQRESRVIPVVFLGVPDPIGLGFVASLARPGGNMTGLLTYEESIAGKWLAMLKEIDPRLARVGLLGNPATTAFDYFLRATKTQAMSLGMEVVSSPVASAADIEQAIASFAGAPNTGMVLPPDSSTIVHSELIIALAARYRLPTVYPFRLFVAVGGLMSYGVDFVEMFKQAAPYVDRILRGAKPADLPVQAPTKFETALNLKTAKALGLAVPSTLLVRADEVIE